MRRNQKHVFTRQLPSPNWCLIALLDYSATRFWEFSQPVFYIWDVGYNLEASADTASFWLLAKTGACHAPILLAAELRTLYSVLFSRKWTWICSKSRDVGRWEHFKQDLCHGCQGLCQGCRGCSEGWKLIEMSISTQTTAYELKPSQIFEFVWPPCLNME